MKSDFLEIVAEAIASRIKSSPEAEEVFWSLAWDIADALIDLGESKRFLAIIGQNIQT